MQNGGELTTVPRRLGGFRASGFLHRPVNRIESPQDDLFSRSFTTTSSQVSHTTRLVFVCHSDYPLPQKKKKEKRIH